MIKSLKTNKKLYFSLLKAVVPGVLFLIVLFSMFFVSNNDKVITSLAKVFYGDNEVELDNWEISTVFYDSTVNNGQTPLTEINWDASNGAAAEGEPRTITVQINYKNTNTVTNYNPGDLKISIPKLIPGCFPTDGNISNPESPGIKTSIIVGANDNYHEGYDWDYLNRSYCSETNFIFGNSKTIESRTNIEGSIQIVYNMEPALEVGRFKNDPSRSRVLSSSELYEDNCLHSIHTDLIASINDSINSLPISFDYRREYTHEWNRQEYQMNIEVSDLASIDNLPSNYNNYYWAKYSFAGYGAGSRPSDTAAYRLLSQSDSSLSTNDYPIMYAIKGEYEVTLPDNVIVYNVEGQEINSFSNNKYLLDVSTKSNSSRMVIYVGYPKSEYSNVQVDISADLFGYYGKSDTRSFLASKDISVNVNNYDIEYNGDLYVFNKTNSSSLIHVNNSNTRRYQDIVNNYGNDAYNDYNTFQYFLYPRVRYNGETNDVYIYDDLLYSLTEGGEYEKCDDDDYYHILIHQYKMKNANGEDIQDGKYDCELWIRRKNSNDYELYDSYKNADKKWEFTKEDEVVNYYIVIKDLKESIWDGTYIQDYLKFRKTDIPEEGNLYNYAALVVKNNGTVRNYGSIDSYDGFVNKDEIAEYDLNKYGGYINRDGDYDSWTYIRYNEVNHVLRTTSGLGTFVDNREKEEFHSKSSFGVHINPKESYNSNYHNEYFVNNKNPVYGFDLYNLLPLGVKSTSSKEEIISSISSYVDSVKIFDINGEELSVNELKQIIKDNIEITINYDWKNTNRERIYAKVDLTDNPIYVLTTKNYFIDSNCLNISLSTNIVVPYDSVIQYGRNYTNEVYARYSTNTLGNSLYNYYPDNYDLNDDGSTADRNTKVESQQTIPIVVSTNQDLQVSVQSDLSNYNTGKVNASNDSEYSYKLRVRTGTNDVTNLVIYDSLEKYAKDSNMASVLASGGRKSWQGEFLGIDTSYAESKGYTVRTYYSESETPGSLSDDDSWVLYTDSVDKSKVKSLAFEYLDSSGNPAVLPANSLTYVLIRMKSPVDPDIKTFAYNGCWTEWNAIDSITGNPVDFITGINSNIVKVALPKSVEPIDIDLDIDKYWIDNNNSLGIRPDTINIQVVPNEDVTKAINVSLGSTNIDPNNSNHWKTSVSVPKYDEDGEVINYSLREGEIILDNGYKYTPTIEGNNVTNTLVKEIELKKIWKDNNNSYLTRPGYVMFVIKQNGVDYDGVTFTGDYSTNEWSKKITVPVFDSSNNEYTYTVSEIVMDGYTPSCSGLVCTNTLSSTKNIIITKEWNDKDNEYNTRPDNIKVNLLRNGTLFQEVTLSGNDWNSNNIEVPLYDENGVKYNYTISEDSIDEYGLVEYDQNNYKITNSLKKKINLVIKKIWVDDNNSNNTRPNELNITLLRNGENYQTVTLTGDTNEWTTSIEVDKYDSSFNKYKYSIKEVNDSISDLYSNVTYSEDELTVTNTLGEITNLTISKKWIDHNNEYLTRPDSIKVNLLQDGVMYREVTISKDKEWKEVINNIPVYDSNHNRHIYTIEESVSIPKYNKVTYDQTNLEVTNELTEVPTVSLYFTVVNGYVDPVTGEMKYDDFGLNEIMKKYNVKAEDEYIFTFELKNLDSGKIYDGKLSTQGILEFRDIPYGDYKAVEGEDKLFDFVDMLSIEEVNGVSFRREGNEGYISIRPTGDNIVFGAKIVNKIIPPIDNPNTGIIIELLILLVLLLPITYSLYLLSKKIKTN